MCPKSVYFNTPENEDEESPSSNSSVISLTKLDINKRT